MSLEGRLTGWIELVSATPLARLDEVKEFFNQLLQSDHNIEVVELQADEGTITKAAFTYWEDDPPSFATLMKPLVELLHEEEYLYFEEKVSIVATPRTLRAVLVTGVGVFKAEQNALQVLLSNRDAEMDAIAESMDAEEKDVELDDGVMPLNGIDELEDNDDADEEDDGVV